MGFAGVATLVVVGVVVGWLAGVAMREGGAGILGDLMLGVAGSGVATMIGWATGLSEGVGTPTLVLLGAVGAAVVIGAQRKAWPVPAPVKPRKVHLTSRP